MDTYLFHHKQGRLAFASQFRKNKKTKNFFQERERERQRDKQTEIRRKRERDREGMKG